MYNACGPIHVTKQKEKQKMQVDNKHKIWSIHLVDPPHNPFMTLLLQCRIIRLKTIGFLVLLKKKKKNYYILILPLN